MARTKQAASTTAAQKRHAIEAAVRGISDSWRLSPAERSRLLRAIQQVRLRGSHEYDAKRVSLLLDIFEWSAAISENLGGAEKFLRAAPEGKASDLSKILSGRLDKLSEVHRDLEKHVYFGTSPA